MPDALPKLVESAFTGIVRRGRWLARIPFVPTFADALAQAAIAIVDPKRLRAMRKLEEEVSSWPGVKCGIHRYGGVAFRRDRSEFGHLHGCGLLDVRLGVAEARLSVAAGRACPHHVLGHSAWVSFWLRRELQLPNALVLLRQAWTRVHEHSTGASAE
ncbi:MAG TPA: DUF5519 family protein [Verrucomicrobiota bacterium]|nr:DUF5519 family protein [Verrucomicrobiota bacterium]